MLNNMKESKRFEKKREIRRRVDDDFGVLDLKSDLASGREGGYQEESDLNKNIEEFEETEKEITKDMAKHKHEFNESKSMVMISYSYLQTMSSKYLIFCNYCRIQCLIYFGVSLLTFSMLITLKNLHRHKLFLMSSTEL